VVVPLSGRFSGREHLRSLGRYPPKPLGLIAWARYVATDDLNIELGSWRALLFDVHNCEQSVDTLTSAVGLIASRRCPHRPLI